MKLITWVVLAILFNFSALGQEVGNNVTVKKVMLVVQDQLGDSGQEYYVRIAKRNDEWSILKYKFKEEVAIDSQVVLKPQARQYEKIKKSFEGAYLAEISDLDATLYRLSPYYGYNGYFLDNIKAFSKKENLTDDELYILGRSYSALYGNYCIGYNSLTLEALKFKLTQLKPGVFNKKQADTLNETFLETVKYYEQLKNRNPNYDTKIVGSIQTKLYNEYLYHYMNLYMFHDKEVAREHIKKGFYDDHFRALGENILNSCPKNAILFTHADNDFYAPLYMQLAYGIRPDVTIINTSLLSLGIYSNALMHYNDVPLDLLIKLEEKKRSPYILTEAEDEPTALTEWLVQAQKIAISDDPDFKLHVNQQIFIGDEENIIELPYFMGRADIMLLAIVDANKGERPIATTDVEGTPMLDEIFERMISTGLVFDINFMEPADQSEDRVSNLGYYFFVKDLVLPSEEPLSSDAFYGEDFYDYPLAFAYYNAKYNKADKKQDFMKKLYAKMKITYGLKGLDRYDW